jgi:hypothetical protein
MMLRSLVFLFLAGALQSSPSQALAAPVDPALRDAISAGIRWYAYWEGIGGLRLDYRPGSRVEARALRTKSHVYAFLASIRMHVNVLTLEPGYRPQFVGGLGLASGRTNAEAVAWFLQRQANAAPGCVGEVSQKTDVLQRPEGTEASLPAVRPCPGREEILADETFTFDLPELTPPDAIQRKTLPPDKDNLVSEVRRYTESLIEPCGWASASIPFYSDADPGVYVFMRRGGDCLSGVATYSRAPDGRWEFGKFFADVPRQGLSGIIARIESNTAISLKR